MFFSLSTLFHLYFSPQLSSIHKTFEGVTLCEALKSLRHNIKMTTQAYIYSSTDAGGMRGEVGLETERKSEVVCKSCLSFTVSFI